MEVERGEVLDGLDVLGADLDGDLGVAVEVDSFAGLAVTADEEGLDGLLL